MASERGRIVESCLVVRGSGSTDRVIVAFGLAGDESNGTSAAISRCGVMAIGTAL